MWFILRKYHIILKSNLFTIFLDLKKSPKKVNINRLNIINKSKIKFEIFYLARIREW